MNKIPKVYKYKLTLRFVNGEERVHILDAKFFAERWEGVRDEIYKGDWIRLGDKYYNAAQLWSFEFIEFSSEEFDGVSEAYGEGESEGDKAMRAW